MSNADEVIDYIVKKTEEVLAEIKKLKEMRKEGKRGDDKGQSVAFQIVALRIQRDLLKEILEFVTDLKKGKEEEKK
jgi:hypothetical protein